MAGDFLFEVAGRARGDFDRGARDVEDVIDIRDIDAGIAEGGGKLIVDLGDDGAGAGDGVGEVVDHHR